MLLSSFIFANECSIDDKVMFAIAENERSKYKPIGYPYLISLNNSSDKDKLGESLKKYMLDGRTIDCKYSELCIKILDLLIKNKITNLDLGAYQINYIFYKIPLNEYFDISKSYLKACKIVKKHTKKDMSWKNIAKYHSGTPEFNKIYREKLMKNVKKYQLELANNE